MKKLFLATAAAIAMFAAPTFAGPTENITGCATAQADNSNFTVFVDPTCYKAKEGSGEARFLFAAWSAYVTDLYGPDEDEDQ